jgi:phosphoribosylformylglycinamidine synthase
MGPPPPIDLAREKEISDTVRSLVLNGLVHAAHDLSDGGLACAAAEMALTSDLGLDLGDQSLENLFSEDQARFIVAANDDQLSRWPKGLSVEMIGTFGEPSGMLSVNGEVLPLEKLRKAHEDWMPNYMASVATE